jgi:hypothetical protein
MDSSGKANERRSAKHNLVIKNVTTDIICVWLYRKRVGSSRLALYPAVRLLSIA